MDTDNFKIRIIKPEDYKRATQFVIKYYYEDEPIFSCNPKIIPGPQDLADIEACLKSNTSLMCYRQTDEGEEIVCITLNIIKYASYVNKYKEIAAKEGNSKYGQYVRLLATMHENINICEKYNVDKFLYCFMCSVNRKYRGKNVCFLMAKASMDLAKKIGIKVYAADCSSFYSAAVLQRMKFDLVNTLLFSDYRDENDRPYFVIQSPHVAVKAYASRL